MVRGKKTGLGGQGKNLLLTRIFMDSMGTRMLVRMSSRVLIRARMLLQKLENTREREEKVSRGEDAYSRRRGEHAPRAAWATHTVAATVTVAATLVPALAVAVTVAN